MGKYPLGHRANYLCFGTEENRRLGSKKARYIRAFRRRDLFCLHIMVGAEGFEPSASWTRTMRDTKLRHAPFFHSFLIIGIFLPNVKGFYAG